MGAPFYTDAEARRQIENLEAAASDWQTRAQSAEASLHEVQALNEELVGALKMAAYRFDFFAKLYRRDGDSALLAMAPSLDEAAQDIQAALLKATPHRGGEGKQGLSSSSVAESGGSRAQEPVKSDSHSHIEKEDL